MKKRVYALLLIMILLLCCIAVLPLPARASTEGAWVLAKVEDYPEQDLVVDYDESSNGMQATRAIHHYAPSDFTYEWFAGEKNPHTEEILTAEGTMSAKFGAMPVRISPDETVTVTVELFSSGYDDIGEYSLYAEAYVGADFSISQDNGVRFEIPFVPEGSFGSSDTISFAIPAPYGSEQNPTRSVSFSLYTNLGGYAPTTTYVYEWSAGAPAQTPSATETPKPAESIELKGVVRSLENKPMRWMKLDAHVFYGTDVYDGRQPDTTVSAATDHEGRYSFSIPAGPEDTGPVGILLAGTLKCVYPYGGQDAFYFVDMQDGFSKDHDAVSVATWLYVDPADHRADEPIRIYRKLSFAELEQGAWSHSMDDWTVGRDPVFHFSEHPDQPRLLANYSTLYTAAFDAWFLGAALLDEAESLTRKPLRIEVRWPITTEMDCSHYDPANHCMRLEDTDSLRDDNSRFTVLHEFGHAFDYITNSGKFRAYAPYGPGNENHGGYLNDTTSDSYIEGFATFYAGTAQLYGGYPNSHILSWIELGDPGAYTAWGHNGHYEELAIASLLYRTHFLMEGIGDYWSLLDPDRDNFYEYYTAIEAYLNGKPAAQALRQYAISAGLYLMPFGNGRYDPGEPFRDLPRGRPGQYDPNEPFGDLMFGVGGNGRIDPSSPLQEYDESELTAGQASDASRVRKTIREPESGYLYLSGETPEYLLVDILPDGEAGSRTQRAVEDGNRVLIGLGDRAMTGRIRVSVPGGNVIYEGDLAELQQLQAENAGLALPLAEARVSAGDLAVPGTAAAATYGGVDASGVLTIPEMSRDELVRLSDGYDPDASLETVTAALAARKDDGGDGGAPPAGRWHILLYIAAGAGVLMIAALILFFCQGRKKSPIAAPGPQPGSSRQATPGVCPNCGAGLPEQAKFCTICGKPASATLPPRHAFCIGCGAKMERDTPFCAKCGQAQPPRQSAALPVSGAPYAPPQPQRSKLWLVIAIAAAAVAVLCAGAYFLFFTGKLSEPQTSVSNIPVETADAVAEPTQEPASAAEYATTRDVADLIGVWEGELKYTEISGDWDTFTYPVSEGYSQPFMLKITEGSPELDWRQAILRIDGGDAAVLNAGFEGRFLEIRGKWQSCDVSISVEYDETRGGFAGIGEYIHSEKHAAFDFFMAATDESAWEGGDISATTQPPSTQITTVSGQTITVDTAYDSGEGVYTGEVNSEGVPHGRGSFIMQKSDKGFDWSYEGQWENGAITGEGVKKDGGFVFAGSFRDGLLNGECEITDDGILRYKGMCRNGKLHGQGTLYTKSGLLLFEGEFDSDMRVESKADRKRRGEAFKPQCEDMDDLMYDACMAEDNIFGYPIHVWGFPLGMAEQAASGTVVIGHFADDSYPVCLLYRYAVGEPKITGDDWVNAWGVVTGLFEYTDANGNPAICPQVEVIYWNDEQEGL